MNKEYEHCVECDIKESKIESLKAQIESVIRKEVYDKQLKLLSLLVIDTNLSFLTCDDVSNLIFNIYSNVFPEDDYLVYDKEENTRIIREYTEYRYVFHGVIIIKRTFANNVGADKYFCGTYNPGFSDDKKFPGVTPFNNVYVLFLILLSILQAGINNGKSVNYISKISNMVNNVYKSRNFNVSKSDIKQILND